MSNRFKSSQMCGTIENIDYPDGSVQAHAKFNRDVEILGDMSMGYEIYDISSNSYIDTGGNLKYKINNVNYTITPTKMIQLVNTLVSDTYLQDVLTAYSTLSNPHFVGIPTAPTPILTDNSTQISTTAFVKNQNYATIYDLSNAFSLLDLSQYATNTNLTTSINNLNIDLYSKITDVSASIFNLNINQYATNNALTNAISNLHVENFVTLSDISGQLVNLNLSQYAKTTELNNAINNLYISNYTTFNDVSGIVFNYAKKSDLTTEISNLNISQYATTSYVTSQISNLVNSAPESLNTLSELSSALGGDPNFSTTVLNLIGTKTTLYDVQSSTLSVSGLVTFNQLPVSYVTPTLNNQLVTKNFVDSNFISNNANGSINGYLRLNNVNGIANKILTLYDATPTQPNLSATSFYGFGVNSNVLRIQTPASSANFSFYADTSLAMQLLGTGKLGIGKVASSTYTIDANGSINATDLLVNGTSIASTYLTQTNANTTYLNKTDASTTYLTQTNATSTYVDKNYASMNYQLKYDTSNNFLSKNDASIQYLNKTDAIATYLSQNSASSQYLSKSNPYGTWPRITNSTNGSYLEIRPSYNYTLDVSGGNPNEYGSVTYTTGSIYSTHFFEGNLYVGNSIGSTNGFLGIGNGNDLSRVGRNLNIDNVLRVKYNDDVDVGAGLSNNANVDVNGPVNASDYLIDGTSIFSNANTWISQNNFNSLASNNYNSLVPTATNYLFNNVTSGNVIIAGTLSGVVSISQNSKGIINIGAGPSCTSDINIGRNDGVNNVYLSQCAFTQNTLTLPSDYSIYGSNKKIFNRTQFGNLAETIQSFTLTSNVLNINYGNLTGGVIMIAPYSNTNMALGLNSFPAIANDSTTYNLTFLIDTSSYKKYINGISVNGTSYTSIMVSAGGLANININSSSTYVLQTISIIFNNSSTPTLIMTNVASLF